MHKNSNLSVLKLDGEEISLPKTQYDVNIVSRKRAFALATAATVQ